MTAFCPYCKTHFEIKPPKYRQKWHNCPGAVAAQKEAKRKRDTLYDKTKRQRKVRPNKVRGLNLRQYYQPAENSKLYPCKSGISPECWVVSHNRINCPACLAILEKTSITHVMGYELVVPDIVI